MHKTTPKTPAEVKRELSEAGITMSEYARTHGFSRMVVVDLLHGRRKGHHGEAHRAALALGLKTGRVVADVKKFKPARAAG